MFDVGFGELLLIAIVALLVLGPERMPAAARTVGALLRRARQSWASVRDEVERELATEDLKRQFRDGADELRKSASELRDEVNRHGADIAAAADPRPTPEQKHEP
ncbi:MAG TPA: Sec-independent protein translocase protein TatB [Rhodanobacteraceae bacterium]|nr:Sec-independent protein translocase protein TatB [Rhodanobacteraceae bacterium]